MNKFLKSKIMLSILIFNFSGFFGTEKLSGVFNQTPWDSPLPMLGDDLGLDDEYLDSLDGIDDNFDFAQSLEDLAGSEEETRKAIEMANEMGIPISENDFKQAMQELKDQCKDPNSREEFNNSMKSLIQSGGADLLEDQAFKTQKKPSTSKKKAPEFQDSFSSKKIDELSDKIDEKKISEENLSTDKNIAPKSLAEMFLSRKAPLSKIEKEFFRTSVTEFIKNINLIISSLELPLIGETDELKEITGLLEQFARNLAFFSRSFQLNILFSASKKSEKELKSSPNQLFATAINESLKLKEAIEKFPTTNYKNALDSSVSELLNKKSKKKIKIKLHAKVDAQLRKTLKALKEADLKLGLMKGSLKTEIEKKKKNLKAALAFASKRYPSAYRNSYYNNFGGRRYNDYDRYSGYNNNRGKYGNQQYEKEALNEKEAPVSAEKSNISDDNDEQKKDSSKSTENQELNPSETLEEFLDSALFKELASFNEKLDRLSFKTLEELTELFLKLDFENIKQRLTIVTKNGVKGKKTKKKESSKELDEENEEEESKKSSSEDERSFIKKKLEKIKRPLKVLAAHPVLLQSSALEPIQTNFLLLPYHHLFDKQFELNLQMQNLIKNPTNNELQKMLVTLQEASTENKTKLESLKKTLELYIFNGGEDKLEKLLEKLQNLRKDASENQNKIIIKELSEANSMQELNQAKNNFSLKKSALRSKNLNKQLEKIIKAIIEQYFFIPIDKQIFKNQEIKGLISNLKTNFTKQYQAHLRFFFGENFTKPGTTPKKTFSETDIETLCSFDVHQILSSFENFLKALGVKAESSQAAEESILKKSLSSLIFLNNFSAEKEPSTGPSFQTWADVFCDFDFMQRFATEELDAKQLTVQSSTEMISWIPLYAKSIYSQNAPSSDIQNLFLRTYNKIINLMNKKESSEFDLTTNTIHFEMIKLNKFEEILDNSFQEKFNNLSACILALMTQVQSELLGEKWEALSSEVVAELFPDSSKSAFNHLCKLTLQLTQNICLSYKTYQFETSTEDMLQLAEEKYSLCQELVKSIYLFVTRDEKPDSSEDSLIIEACNKIDLIGQKMTSKKHQSLLTLQNLCLIFALEEPGALKNIDPETYSCLVKITENVLKNFAYVSLKKDSLESDSNSSFFDDSHQKVKTAEVESAWELIKTFNKMINQLSKISEKAELEAIDVVNKSLLELGTEKESLAKKISLILRKSRSDLTDLASQKKEEAEKEPIYNLSARIEEALLIIEALQTIKNNGGPSEEKTDKDGPSAEQIDEEQEAEEDPDKDSKRADEESEQILSNIDEASINDILNSLTRNP